MSDSSPTTIVAIDVGTYKIAVLIAKIHAANKIEVLGMAVKPNLGISKGTISNMGRVAASIQEAVTAAEESSGLQVHSAWVSVPSNDIKSCNATGKTLVSENTVSASTMARAFEEAKLSCLKPDYYLINSIQQGVELDNQGDWVSHPLGMTAREISSHYHLMMLPVTTMQNLEKTLKMASIRVDRMIIATLATAEAALLPDEKEYGVCLIDIGGSTTNIAVYLENRLILSHTFLLGGEHVTRDIAGVLQTSTRHAETLKTTKGCVDINLIKHGEMVKVASLTGSSTREVIERTTLADIIIARYEEILETVRDYLEDSGAINVLQLGVVLAGGASTIEGLTTLTQRVLGGLPVRLYTHPSSVIATNDAFAASLYQPTYATAAGLLLFSQGEMQKHDIEINAISVDHVAWFTRLFVVPWRKLMEMLKQLI